MTSTPADGSHLIRSEERLIVGREVVPVRRAVLRIETVSEQVMVPVTITRQRARIDYVDIDPSTAVPVTQDLLIGDAATGALSDWVVLTADEAVVTTRPVPVERVRLVTEWVTLHQEIQADVSREVITEDVSLGTATGQHATS